MYKKAPGKKALAKAIVFLSVFLSWQFAVRLAFKSREILMYIDWKHLQNDEIFLMSFEALFEHPPQRRVHRFLGLLFFSVFELRHSPYHHNGATWP